MNAFLASWMRVVRRLRQSQTIREHEIKSLKLLLKNDGFVKSPSTAFCFILRHCGVLLCTPHSSGFARLASGSFFFAVLFRLFTMTSTFIRSIFVASFSSRPLVNNSPSEFKDDPASYGKGKRFRSHSLDGYSSWDIIQSQIKTYRLSPCA